MSLQDILPYRLPNHVGKRLIDPHVVIVGAGASIAACEIDKNGKKVPLLKNIHNILGLTDELKKYNFSDEQMEDFEKLFSDIAPMCTSESLPHIPCSYNTILFCWKHTDIPHIYPEHPTSKTSTSFLLYFLFHK